MPKQKKRLTKKEKEREFKTVKAWLDEKDKARKREEGEELGKLVVDYRAFIKKHQHPVVVRHSTPW